MSQRIAPGILLDSGHPVDQHLLDCRQILLENKKFLKIFQAIDQPAAVLTTTHQVVMANTLLTAWVGKSTDEDLLGCIPGDLCPTPGCPDLLARTRYIEVRGNGFFILTVHEEGAGL